MKIAVAGFQHETNSFVAGHADFDAFQAPGGWPRFSRGNAVLDTLPDSAAPMSGALRVARAHGCRIEPLLWCIALPSGPVDDSAFERIAGDIESGFAKLVAAGALDGLYLDLHGAMVTSRHPDAEGELLRRLRQIAPDPFPIVCSLDPHANVSRAMVDHATLLDAYRTYPHVDMAETGGRAMEQLVAMIASGARPQKLFRPIPFLVPLDTQCTLTDPMRSLADLRHDLARTEGVDSISQCFGFPLADISDTGPSLILYGENRDGLAQAADRLESAWLESEHAFGRALPTAKDAIADALARLETDPTGPVVIADTQDNPGGGGTGDTAGMLRALLEANASGAVLVHIAQPDAARAAHEAGTGQSLDISLGGQLTPEYGAPVSGPFRVGALGDGRFVGVGPMYHGNQIDLGPVALLEKNGVLVIVASRKMQASEPALLHHLGLDPARLPILVVKSSVHFRGAYQDMADAVIPALAPGPVTARLDTLGYRHAIRRVAGAATENEHA
ncbi:M81 family metallopeptidase [Rhodobacteraceae bacterium F11138]|nr:M81 family metallopeptidase [Rhodobacteraceae bacterium F11138]